MSSAVEKSLQKDKFRTFISLFGQEFQFFLSTCKKMQKELTSSIW